MKKYNFIDATYFNPSESKDKNIFDKKIECDCPSKASSKKLDGIFDPNVSIIEVDDIKKGS